MFEWHILHACHRQVHAAVVVQHPEDGFQDGHEAVFQSGAAKHQYRCFLQSLAKGTPKVPAGADEEAPCN